MAANVIETHAELDALTLEELYQAVPVQNESATSRPVKDGLVLEIPLRKPEGRWSILAWFVPLSSDRKIYLDDLGGNVFANCDGNTNVRTIIYEFADRYRLTFHESRLSIMMFLKSLIQRGAIAIVLEPGGERT